MRIAVLAFAVAAFFATGIAGGFRAFSTVRPRRFGGGTVIILMGEFVPGDKCKDRYDTQRLALLGYFAAGIGSAAVAWLAQDLAGYR